MHNYRYYAYDVYSVRDENGCVIQLKKNWRICNSIIINKKIKHITFYINKTQIAFYAYWLSIYKGYQTIMADELNLNQFDKLFKI